jgi:hypothetical protein
MFDVSLNTQTILAGVSIGLFVFYVIKRMRYRLPPGSWGIPLVGSYSGHFPKLGNFGHRYEISICQENQCYYLDPILKAFIEKAVCN